MEQIEFIRKEGAQFPEEKTKQYGEYLHYLSTILKHDPQPDEIVQDASVPSSPLHDYFEWDNDKCGVHYRKQQARNLLNHIEIRIIHETKEFIIPAYSHIIVNQNKRYVSTVEALSDEEMRQQMLNEALQQLHYWKEKYKILKELNQIVTSIEEFETQHNETKLNGTKRNQTQPN